MDALDLSGSADVAGTALSSGVALAFAACMPERIRKLAVSSPAFGGASGIEAMLRARADQVEQKGMRGQADTSLDRFFLPKHRLDASAFQDYRARWISNDPSSYASHTCMLAGMDERANLAKIACPTLVLGGEDDALLTPSAMQEVAEAITGAEYQKLASGHFLPVNTPDLWAETVLPFLDR